MIGCPDSELAVIGLAMLEREGAAEAYERLREEHFSEPLFGRVWDHVRQRRGAVDPVLLSQAFAHDVGFSEIGGLELFAEAVNNSPPTWSLPGHIDAVIDAAVRRELCGLSKDIGHRANLFGGQGETLLIELERGAADIARSHTTKPLATPAGIGALDMLETAYAGGFVGSPVGLEALDRVTGGIKQDDVWVIGGRTSMGKSVVGLCLARGIAEQGRGVMVFSLEMPLREVQARLIADIAYDRRIPENSQDGGNVRYGDILKGRGTTPQRDRARRAAKALASLPIVVNDQGGLTIEEIRSQALRQIRAWETAGVRAGAILIDHIGLVRAHTKRGDSKAAETADIVNELKAIAKQIRAPIITLSQVNRATEGRNDKRPTVADLNWSGAIEQIADFICLLYRDAYYLERAQDEDSRIEAVRAKYDIELLIAKNRSGPICNLKAFADVACNSIRDLEADHERSHGVSF